MNRQGVINLILVCILIAGFTMVGFIAGTARGSDYDGPPIALGTARKADGAALVDQALRIIEHHYYMKIDDETRQKLIYGAVHGLFTVLRDEPFKDYYSFFYDPEYYKDLEAQTTGQYAGIGILMGLTDNGMYPEVVTVFPGTPAEEKGMQSDDIITNVEGEDTFGMAMDEVAARIKGVPESKVKLTILRPLSGEYLDLEITRRIVEFKSVDPGKLLEGGVGYIKITSFSEDTGKEFRAQCETLTAQGMKSLVIDLRNNAGGLLNTAVEVADCFIKKGLIVEVDQRDQPPSQINADPAAKKFDIPLVVLVNSASASASEILAGALQDSGLAKVVGEQSFGKGVVQEVFELEPQPVYEKKPDGTVVQGKVTKDAVAVTIGKYYTPSHKEIHGVGIAPNIWYDLNNQAQDDTQLQQLDKKIMGLITELQDLRTQRAKLIRGNDLQMERARQVALALGKGEQVADVPKLAVEYDPFAAQRMPGRPGPPSDDQSKKDSGSSGAAPEQPANPPPPEEHK